MYTLVRFIPAYAGNTLGIATIVASPSVYPRIRGEHLIRAGRLSHANGLSPHTRGTRVRQNLSNLTRRFIPAYAGNTIGAATIVPSPAVYPRIRGEHDWSCNHRSVTRGLSPHTRGTRLELQPSFRHPRFIPAYAGNTIGAATIVPSPAVYPRIRGEHDWSCNHRSVTRGLSPHTRGTRLELQPSFRHPRFIPAYAGNTIGAATIVPSPAVYPRIRGEHVRKSNDRCVTLGVSPHTRGTRVRQNLSNLHRRFIPAYAGNT